MNPEKTHIILGPPGTGKTTKLLQIVDGIITSGVDTSRICLITFTRRAANEAITRAVAKFNKPAHFFPLFRTLHSLAFRQLGIQRSQVMRFNDYVTIGESLGLCLSPGIVQNEDGVMAGMTKGDRLVFYDNLARTMRLTHDELWVKLNEDDLNLAELLQVHETILNYKIMHEKIDFTDMVLKFIEKRPLPVMDFLLVDEAQDLSRSQWDMIDVLSQAGCPVYLAGDDDQAIFRWAGADIDMWINLQGSVEVLDQSYRVPGKICDLANQIVSGIEVRRPKRWNPRKEAEGEIIYVAGLELIDMDRGTWLLLARNSHYLKRYVEWCILQGFIFEYNGTTPFNGEGWDAVRYWERLRAGKSISIEDAVKVYDFMEVRVHYLWGFKKKIVNFAKDNPGREINIHELKDKFGLVTEKIWHEALTGLTEQDRIYFLTALRRGEKVTQEPRIRINTIHGAKGAEADNVVLFSDMVYRTYLEYQRNEDDERRVWYVGVTRARNRLYVIRPETLRHFDLT